MVRDFVRISIQGSLPGGEVWSVNPCFVGNFTSGTPVTPEALQTWTDAIRDAIPTAVGQQLQGLMSQSAAITGVRAAYYDATGALAAIALSLLASPFAGSGSQTSPTSTALVCSLYSATQSRSGRGRIYWPALKLSIDQATGRITQSQLPTVASEFNAMFAALEAAGPDSWAPILAVMSQKQGAGHPITQLRVGDVPDSQRRRRDAYVENYAAVTFG